MARARALPVEMVPIRIVIDDTISYDAEDANEAEMFLTCAGVKRPSAMLTAVRRWGKVNCDEAALMLATNAGSERPPVDASSREMDSHAFKLLKMAEANGGGLEPRDVLGLAADGMDTAQLLWALQAHPGLAECLSGQMLELKHDDNLVPPFYFLLTRSASEQMNDLRDN